MEQLLKSRRSIRKYKPDLIEKEKTDSIIKCALMAPSSRSRRPWEIMVVQDKELIKKLAHAKGSQSFIKDAPLVFAIIGQPNVSDVWVEDCSIVSTLIQLQAHNLGLGSCWIQIRNRMYSDEETSAQYVKRILDLDDKFDILSLISVGYKDEQKEAYSDSDLMFDKVMWR